MKYILSAVVAGTLLLSTGCETEVVEPVTVAEDISQVAPQMAQRLIDNDYVAVTRFVLKPREVLPLHKGLDRVVYSLSRYRLRVQQQGEAAVMKDFQPGDIHWHAADVHTVSNGGTLTAKYVTVERKAPYPPPKEPSNLTSVARGYASLILNNNDVRVIEVNLAAKGRVPKHNGDGQVICVVTPAKIRFTSGSETVEKEFQEGDAIWQEAGSNTVRNLSGEPIKFLVIQFKREE